MVAGAMETILQELHLALFPPLHQSHLFHPGPSFTVSLIALIFFWGLSSGLLSSWSLLGPVHHCNDEL